LTHQREDWLLIDAVFAKYRSTSASPSMSANSTSRESARMTGNCVAVTFVKTPSVPPCAKPWFAQSTLCWFPKSPPLAKAASQSPSRSTSAKSTFSV
jgi:hypothetical protein